MKPLAHPVCFPLATLDPSAHCNNHTSVQATMALEFPPWATLPNDLWIKILGNLDTPLTANPRKACKAMMQGSDGSAKHLTIKLRIPSNKIEFAALAGLFTKWVNLSSINLLVDDKQVSCEAFVDPQVETFTKLLETLVPNLQSLHLVAGCRCETATHILSAVGGKLHSLFLHAEKQFYTPECSLCFSQLRKLDVGCFVQDIEFCAHLPHLEKLNVSVTGSISVSALSNMPLLQALSLRMRSGVDFDGIHQLQNLKELRVNCHTATDVGHISKLTCLEHLDLILSKVENIDILSSLQNLVSLRIYCSSLRNFNLIPSMTRLRCLHIDGGANVRDITINSKLEALALINHKLSASEITMISAVQSLTRLDLTWCKGLEADKILPLAKLTNLTALSFQSTPAPAATIQILRNALPKLQVLDVSGCSPVNTNSEGEWEETTGPPEWLTYYT